MNATRKHLLPGSTVGILGGGQLGRMIALEGKKMGYRFITLDPIADCPGAEAADRHIAAPYHDEVAARRMASACDVITYEFENVDDTIVRILEEESFLPQGGALLEVTRHRLREKNALLKAGIPVAPFREVANKDELRRALDDIGFPSVLKTVTGGYDGKGQWILRKVEDVEAAIHDFAEGETRILEQFVPFTKEISVIAARGQDGEIRCFTPVENIHRDHILHMTLAPAPVGRKVLETAEELARKIAEHLDVVGLIAVEMFLKEDGQILVNELAPRPHNSGHFTYDACTVSQFEQHLRAVCGLPLGSPRLLSPAVMVNILGQHVDALMKKLPDLPPEVKVHWYGKEDSRRGRKMGHVTALAASTEEARRILEDLAIWD
ncbi:5-(carboxyamino)imidazole ribonucleotide synthase [Salinithrix halophila]|uniref:N5-carboxyaminoimidazole ribonucleotide synthase n=1 Tax=Salinithrix halophila TaxID=1485204 RepID=A0ABV8J9R3_9BACL